MLASPVGTLEGLVTFSGAAAWLFYALVAAATIALRLRGDRDAAASGAPPPRSFRMPLFPLVPLVVVFVGIGLTVSTALREPAPAVGAVGFVASGLLVHVMGVCSQPRGSSADGGSRGGRGSIGDDDGSFSMSSSMRGGDESPPPDGTIVVATATF